MIEARETSSLVDEPVERPAAEAVAALVAHHREFLAFLERRVGSRAEAEDLLQDAFVRGLDKLDSLRDEERVVAWFYRMLRNALVDRARRHQARASSLSRLAAELESRDEPSPEMRESICRCVSLLSETLKPEYRDALRSIELEGLSVKDYAEQLGISSGNAGVRVFRAREALRKQLVRSCGTCAEHGCLDCSCGAHAEAGCGRD